MAFRIAKSEILCRAAVLHRVCTELFVHHRRSLRFPPVFASDSLLNAALQVLLHHCLLQQPGCTSVVRRSLEVTASMLLLNSASSGSNSLRWLSRSLTPAWPPCLFEQLSSLLRVPFRVRACCARICPDSLYIPFSERTQLSPESCRRGATSSSSRDCTLFEQRRLHCADAETLHGVSDRRDKNRSRRSPWGAVALLTLACCWLCSCRSSPRVRRCSWVCSSLPAVGHALSFLLGICCASIGISLCTVFLVVLGSISTVLTMCSTWVFTTCCAFFVTLWIFVLTVKPIICAAYARLFELQSYLAPAFSRAMHQSRLRSLLPSWSLSACAPLREASTPRPRSSLTTCVLLCKTFRVVTPQTSLTSKAEGISWDWSYLRHSIADRIVSVAKVVTPCGRSLKLPCRCTLSCAQVFVVPVVTASWRAWWSVGTINMSRLYWSTGQRTCGAVLRGRVIGLADLLAFAPEHSPWAVSVLCAFLAVVVSTAALSTSCSPRCLPRIWPPAVICRVHHSSCMISQWMFLRPVVTSAVYSVSTASSAISRLLCPFSPRAVLQVVQPVQHSSVRIKPTSRRKRDTPSLSPRVARRRHSWQRITLCH